MQAFAGSAPVEHLGLHVGVLVTVRVLHLSASTCTSESPARFPRLSVWRVARR